MPYILNTPSCATPLGFGATSQSPSASSFSSSPSSYSSNFSPFKTPSCTGQCRYTECTHQLRYQQQQSFRNTMGNNPFDNDLSARTSQLHLSPEDQTRGSSTRSSRSPSGFSLRRTLSGRSRDGETGGERHSRASIISSMFSGRSQRPESPPPPYSPRASGPAPVREPALPPVPPSVPPKNASVADDQYAFLKEFNTIFLIDDSLSMKAEQRWSETQAAVAAILPICTEHDEDGVDVYFLNHRTNDKGDPSRGAVGTGYRGVRDARTIQNLFNRVVRPSLATPTGLRLDHILRAYLSHYETVVRKSGGDVYAARPINIIVITDGQPTDEPSEIITAAARRLDAMRAPPHQIGVQFFQVGRDPGATQSLRELDDELCHREGIRDMVDTATFNGATKADQPTLTADGILKVVLGAVKRKLDRKVLVRVDGPSRYN
ncbi:uncharacterized protein F4822DRAFT_402158 [Hypoxylon trugodes]|uniref:uncharacterized protein n=1 Tax=Hypoxylon trugodes TaxID=326681 RepID=UPI00218E2587|nr:uncharacterized protein F4822DRAFT_402158 [Hypoxylon trugodes]KAI1388215.1 hypothetical protein F4822DRAFT_402158 [Hypoxylon trugodes]